MRPIARIIFVATTCALLLQGCLDSDAKLLELRRYQSVTISILNQNYVIHAASKWHDGKIQYQAVIVPFDSNVASLNTPGGSNHILTLRFLDGDGFVVKEVTPWFAQGVTKDDDGKRVVVYDDTTDLTRDAYLRITRFDTTYIKK